MQSDLAYKSIFANSLPVGIVNTFGEPAGLLSVVYVVPVLALQPKDTPSFVLKYSVSKQPYDIPL